MSERDELTYSDFFGADREGLKLGPDRHPKWQRVEPGTVIPAGQPYRVEHHHGSPYAQEFIWPMSEQRLDLPERDYFIDSSWKPPLVLPTEPTWGIVVICDGPTWRERLGQWALVGNGKRLREQRYFNEWRTEWVKAFIPLTDEQVARIEAAR